MNIQDRRGAFTFSRYSCARM